MYSFNADLISDLARQRVVLFLGAGVSASAAVAGGGRFKTWRPFLETASDLVNDVVSKNFIKSLINQGDLIMAAEMLREVLGEAEWEATLRNEYARSAIPSKLHEAIIRLDQRIIITTNFDKLIDQAWQNFNSTATHYPQVLTAAESGVFKILRDESYCIIKLHGSIDEPDKLIFSKADYNKGAFSNWNYQTLLQTLLMNYTFLFVGFSMADPAVSMVVEMHAQHLPSSRPHYMFVSGEFPAAYIQINKKLRRLFIMPYDPAYDHAELTRMIEELANQTDTSRRLKLSAGLGRP